MSEPLSDEKLARIRERRRSIILFPAGPMGPSDGTVKQIRDMAQDNADLLTEVERLRAAASHSEYQLCPKCNGQKHVAIPPWHPGDQPYHTSSGGTALELHTCIICNGAGVIERPKAKE